MKPLPTDFDSVDREVPAGFEKATAAAMFAGSQVATDYDRVTGDDAFLR